MNTTLGRTHHRKPGHELGGEQVMLEALRPQRVVMPRGLHHYLEAVHRCGLHRTQEFRLRQQAGLRLQAKLARGN